MAAARPEIFDYGLRNPWRFAFDRVTGDLVIGDVGQGRARGSRLGAGSAPGRAQLRLERFEGPRLRRAKARRRLPGLRVPAQGGACSIIGGVVVRDPALSPLRAGISTRDFCTGASGSSVCRPRRTTPTPSSTSRCSSASARTPADVSTPSRSVGRSLASPGREARARAVPGRGRQQTTITSRPPRRRRARSHSGSRRPRPARPSSAASMLAGGRMHVAGGAHPSRGDAHLRRARHRPGGNRRRDTRAGLGRGRVPETRAARRSPACLRRVSSLTSDSAVR